MADPAIVPTTILATLPSKTIARNVALNLVIYHFVAFLPDAMHDHFICFSHQRAFFLNFPRLDIAKRRRSVRYSSF